MNNKVILIGCGNVGTSLAYSLLNQNSPVNELILIDINEDKALGEVMDLNHSLPFLNSKTKVKIGTYKDISDAKIICICAGINQKTKETRLDLIKKNKQIIEDIVKNSLKYNFNGIFLIATNPVDIITNIVYEKANFPPNKVIGSGTSLDTSRLRYLIGEKLNINPKNIHGYVLGEHGDSAFIPWSIARIGLTEIGNYLNQQELKVIQEEVKESAYKIIEKKGFTNFGIGVCLVKIINAILNDENSIITVSCYHELENIYISQPAIINKNGIKEIINLNLSKTEQKLFKNSIEILKEIKQNL